jgi:nucleoside-diphosphate-sugar epimerase
MTGEGAVPPPGTAPGGQTVLVTGAAGFIGSHLVGARLGAAPVWWFLDNFNPF